MSPRRKNFVLSDDPLWIKDAVIYELHVRSFFDATNDGVGDFRGLAQKLDYLQELGVTALWLLPFFPSPLKDDGYDISDYTGVHSIYGSLRDFENLLGEAHSRGLRVITELVLNHTSDQHPWFRRARRSPPGSVWRDFYVWSETPERYKEARTIFKDFEPSNWTWDPVAKAYYWHRFYSHQPDLNYDHPPVREAMLQVVDFWLGLGVDGLRLDAVPYLYERDGTSCENLRETHEFLKELRRHVDAKFRDRVLVAEANQWPDDAVSYFGNGDECHMAYHFPLMPRLFMAVRMEDRFPIVDILAQTPSIPGNCQWALFLRNHDELTLEMVTDEERDYMYRVYANDPRARVNLGIRRRLGPLLDNNRRKIELLNGLLFSLPGTPFVYYGEEIGMGDNIYLGDRNAVRTPMQWSADRNAGFSKAKAQSLFLPVIIEPEYHYESVNIEAQQNNPSSLLWWMKRIIALRKRFKAFGRGSFELLHPQNRKVLAFVRRHESETILVLANLSRFVQQVQLNLSSFKDMAPCELFGGTRLPPIGDQPYPLTFGPHGFYWFSLEPKAAVEVRATAQMAEAPTISLPVKSEDLFESSGREALESALLPFLRRQEWFTDARRAKSAVLKDAVPVPAEGSTAFVGLVQVEFEEGDARTYLVPLAVISGEQVPHILREHPRSVVARYVKKDGPSVEEGVVCDALVDAGFRRALLGGHRRRLRGEGGEIVVSVRRHGRQSREEDVEPTLLKEGKGSASVIYGERWILKLFRSLEEGPNLDLEIGTFLTEKTSFASTPPVVGSIEYDSSRGARMILGILHGYVRNEGDAWQHAIDALGRYFERTLTGQVSESPEAMTFPEEPILNLTEAELPSLAFETLGTFHPVVQLLAQRIAELHLALASEREDPEFAPEPFTPHYQRSLYQSLRNLTGNTLDAVAAALKDLSGPAAEAAQEVIGLREDILRRFSWIRDQKVTGLRIRCHGNLHLEKMLRAGNELSVVDFSGEPTRSTIERRLKRSPLRDVAAMLRSFHLASHTALHGGGLTRPQDMSVLQPRARMWNFWVSTLFLKSYFDTCRGAPFLPVSQVEIRRLTYLLYLEKVLFELGYTVARNPDQLLTPLQGLLRVLKAPG